MLWLGAIVGWKRPDLALEVAARAPDMTLRLAGAALDGDGQRLAAELSARALREGLAERSRSSAPWNRRRRSGPPACCSTPPTASRSGSRSPRRWRAACQSSPPPPAARRRSWTTSCGRLFPPGDADAGPHTPCGEVLETRDALAAGRAPARRGAVRPRAGSRALRRARRTPRAPREPATQRARAWRSSRSRTTRPRELETLLASAERHLPGAQLVVVDSGSSGRQRRGRAAPRRDRRSSCDNVGYGAAANAGVAAVDEPVTVVAQPGRRAARRVARRRSRTSSAGPARPSGSSSRPSSCRTAAGRTSPSTSRRRSPLVAAALVPPAAAAAAAAHGARPVARGVARGGPAGRSAHASPRGPRRCGGSGPSTPRSSSTREDLDLGLRAADAGIETWFWPGARVLHTRAHATRRAFGGEPFELLARRRREVISARRGAASRAVSTTSSRPSRSPTGSR